MDRLCKLSVRESPPRCRWSRHVYIGKGGTDMVVVERLGRVAVQPRPETPGHPWHPSVDVLVDSALKLLPPRDLGVLLTGMGNDGAQAMARLKQPGRPHDRRVGGHRGGLRHAAGTDRTRRRQLVLPCQDVARQLCHWIMKTR
jgi:two-component system chemotaxis response regulator CheB